MIDRRRVWPHVRAALVSFHVVAIVASAVPAPEGGMDRRTWQEPTVQTEFAQWAHWLGMPESAFENRLWSVATAYMAARALVMRPLAPYFDVTGAQQPWRLFVAPHRFPGRYEVQFQRAGENEWTTAFEERSETARWHATFFESERIRSALFRYEWPSYAPDARRFCGYVVAQLFADMHDATNARCRFYKARSPSAAEVRAGIEPEGEWTGTVTISREASEAP